ncbi:MAG TPA: GAF domain-containing protein [Anaerolineae bacterium]|nr:GAF domain-containing protein [Anaerolineae bacterium]
MQEQYKQREKLETQQRTSAFRLVASLLGLTVASLVVTIGYSLRVDGVFDAPLILVILFVAYVVALVLIRQSFNLNWAILVVLLGLYGGIGYTLTQSSGITVVGLLLVTLVSLAIVSQLAASSVFLIYVVGIILGSAGLLLADLLYFSSARDSVTEFYVQYGWGGVAVLTLLVAFLLGRDFTNYPLRTKLVLAFLIVSLIPLGVLGGIQIQSTREALIEGGNKALAGAATQTAARIDDFLLGQIENIRVESGLIGANDYFSLPREERAGSEEEAEVIELLKVFRDKDPLRIRSYAFIDLGGNVILAYPPSALRDGGQNVAHTDYFQKALTGSQPYISYVQFPTESTVGFFYVSSVVRASDGEIVGVIRNEYDATVFQDLITRATSLIGGQSFAALYDDEYLHLAHGNDDELQYRFVEAVDEARIERLKEERRWPNLPVAEASANLPDLARNLDAASSEDNFAVQAVAGQQELNQAAVATLKEQPWLIVFYQPQDSFLLSVVAQVRSLVTLVLGVIVVVILVAVGVSQLLTAPIIRLNEVAIQVTGGDLSAHADIQSGDEIGTLALTFNEMTAQLRETLTGLEQRVQERTRDLETSTAVSQRLSTILDPDQLIGEVAAQVQKAFNYYHVHIYVFNKRRDFLVMAGGTGEAGQAMLASGHRLRANQGLVGRSASNNAVVFVENVRVDEDWVPHPLLPDTQTEAAIPISVGNDVIGVLDVQHNVLGELSREHLALLQSIANQVAIALQNSQLFAQSQQVAETEAMKNRISQRIQQADTVEAVLQVAAEELGTALGAAKTHIALGNKQIGGGSS